MIARSVRHAQNQIRFTHTVQGGTEGVDQIGRNVADKTHGINHDGRET